MKLSILISHLILIVSMSFGQSRPRIYIDASYTCDTTPYKLVFEDHFDGNQLDTSFWTTHLSWHSTYQIIDGQMVYGDHPNYCGARSCYQNAFYLDENVKVSDGTCKLMIRNEAKTLPCILGIHDDIKICNEYNQLNCPDSTTKYYTVGGIFSKFRFPNRPDGSPHTNHFSNGKFEARLKHPVAEGTWSCMWTWYGTRVNEIDITEAWGGKERTIFNHLTNAGGKRSANLRRNIWAFHAWHYPQNPYGFPSHGQDEVSYDLFSGQNWTDAFNTRKMHRQNDWHTYTCEWDTNVVRIYVDDILEKELYKYFKYKEVDDGRSGEKYKLRIPADCNADSGWYYLTEGFPYEHNSMSQLRFNTSLTADNIGFPPKNIFIDQMEIDYVKIWQRHPELDGRTVERRTSETIDVDSSLKGMNSIDTPSIILIAADFEDFGKQFFGFVSDFDHYDVIWEYEIIDGDQLVKWGSHNGAYFSTESIYAEWSDLELKWFVKIQQDTQKVQVYAGNYIPNTQAIESLHEVDEREMNGDKLWKFKAAISQHEFPKYHSLTNAFLQQKYITKDASKQLQKDFINKSEINALFYYLHFQNPISYKTFEE